MSLNSGIHRGIWPLLDFARWAITPNCSCLVFDVPKAEKCFCSSAAATNPWFGPALALAGSKEVRERRIRLGPVCQIQVGGHSCGSSQSQKTNNASATQHRWASMPQWHGRTGPAQVLSRGVQPVLTRTQKAKTINFLPPLRVSEPDSQCFWWSRMSTRRIAKGEVMIGHRPMCHIVHQM